MVRLIEFIVHVSSLQG